MKPFLRNPRVLAAAGFVLLLLLVAFWPSAVEVDVAVVERGPMQVTVDEEGETRVREPFVIHAPVTGRLRRIELEPGDRVAAGATVVATIVPVPLDPRARAEAQAAAAAATSALGRARAERERAAEAMSLARSELERLRALAAAQVISPQALESQEAAFRSAQDALRAADFAVATAAHEREMAQARLGSGAEGDARPIRVEAPVGGVVLRRHRESEGVVTAGQPLLEIGDPGALEIVSDLLSTDAVRVSAGDRVIIEQWGGEQPLQGRVRLVEPSGFTKVSALGVEEQRVNVVIDFTDPGAARALGDGYRVEVRIVVWEAPEVLKVPTSALFRRGDAWAVFVADGGRARVRTLELGRRNGLTAQVLSGIEPGTAVVVHPSVELEDGARIARRDQ